MQLYTSPWSSFIDKGIVTSFLQLALLLKYNNRHLILALSIKQNRPQGCTDHDSDSATARQGEKIV